MKLQHLKVVRPISRLVNRSMLKANKNAPTILFVGGVVGVVGATVLACKATLQVEPVLEQAEKDMTHVKTIVLPTARTPQGAYSDKDRSKDLLRIKLHLAGDLAKLYAPAAIVGTASILCLTKSHNILMERNTALMAAYSAVDYAFREYRARVVEELGPEKDEEFRHGSEVRTLVEKTAKGSKTSQVKTADTKGKPSMYARWFDDSSTEWSRDPEYNLHYIRCQEVFANKKLRACGHVFLNEIYDALGLKRTTAGAVVGWVWDGEGDNEIDFGVFNGENDRARAFVNGLEGSILLDFNVDGVIYDLLDKR